jgi:uroporphyrinogen-III synthase
MRPIGITGAGPMTSPRGGHDGGFAPKPPGHDEGFAPKPAGGGFGGLVVVSFESRRAPEMASLIERHGGRALPAPSMREVPREASPEALVLADALERDEVDVLVLMTGVGTRALLAALAPRMDLAAFAAALARTTVIVRGPKPAAALRAIGVTRFLLAPSPNTSAEVLGVIRAHAADARAANLRIFVQEHGAPSQELYAALRSDGHVVSPVPVYAWALPEDTGPLRAALGAIARGDARVALFTSATQVAHVMRVAADERVEAEVRNALARGVVASIGPVCSEALEADGLPPDLEPEHPKMGHLVKAAAERAPAILLAKTRGAAGDHSS